MNKRKLKCLLSGHDWKFISRSKDWLAGGEYTYQCTRCDKFLLSRPYQGGEW